MQKALKLARTISAKIDADHSEAIEDINLHWVFQPLDELLLERRQVNTLICAIIYSYDNESTWFDLKQDGHTINRNILKGLRADIEDALFKKFIHQNDRNIGEATGNYLDMLNDWRFVTIRKHIDYHAKYIRQTENAEDFKGLDAAKMNAARESIGKLMRESVNHRKAADALIQEIHKDFMSTNERVKQDFGVSFIDESIKLDPYSWRDFIKYKYEPMQKHKKESVQSKLPI